MATTGIYALSTSDVNKLSDLPATFNSRIYMEALKAVSDETVYKIYNPHGKLSYVGFQYGTNAPIEWHQFIINTDLFSVHFIAQTFNGYVEYFDARIKSDMNCVASIKYSGVVLNYILNVQVHNGSFIIYVRTPEGTIPQDNTNINIYAIFAK